MAPAVTGWTVCRFHEARGGGPKGSATACIGNGRVSSKASVSPARYSIASPTMSIFWSCGENYRLKQSKARRRREGRSRNQLNHQRLLNAAASSFFARAKLARFCSAPMAQRIVMVRFKRALPPGTYAGELAYGLGPPPGDSKMRRRDRPPKRRQKPPQREFGTEERPDASA